MVAQVHLEAEALYDRQVGLHDEGGGARAWDVRRHVAPPLAQHRVDGRDAVCRACKIMLRMHESLLEFLGLTGTAAVDKGV